MSDGEDRGRSAGSIGTTIVRYGIGAAMVVAGVVMIVVNPGGFGVDGFAMAVGGGLSVLMINFLFRLGVSGDEERRREEQARQYFDEHGVWPDDDQARRERRWNLPAGAVTAADEKRDQDGKGFRSGGTGRLDAEGTS